jgi:large subunit ribosomal protein L54
MICHHCRTRLLFRLPFQYSLSVSSLRSGLPVHGSQMRNSSSIAATPPPAPRRPAPGSGSVVITPAGSSKPLNTPDSPPPTEIDKPMKPVVERTLGSCLAGTKLSGLNYMKNKPDIFAMEDSDYPDWLWGLLDNSKKQFASETGGVDLSSMVPCTCFTLFRAHLLAFLQ